MSDVNSLIGRGLLIPFRRQGRDFVEGSGLILLRSSISQILSTRKGEIRWRPDFGLDVERMRHRNITEEFMGELEADILDSILTHEPRVDVVSVVLERLRNSTKITAKVTWRALAQSGRGNTVLTGEEITEVQI